MIDIELPWPDASLSPNSRTNWHVKSPVFKTAKEEARIETISQAPSRMSLIGWDSIGYIKVKIYFYPPDKRARDVDNMLASVKAYIDGVAQALNVNDSKFNPIEIVRCVNIKNGMVKFELTEGGNK